MARWWLAAVLTAAVVALPGAASAGAAAAPLAGTSWVFERVEGRAVPADYVATLRFRADGEFRGRACFNTISGGYARRGAALRFSRITSTLVGCESEGARPQVIRVLRRTRSHRRRAGRLVLLGARGRVLARLAPAR